MDEFIEILADALRAEFSFLNGPKTKDDAFQKAAAGIAQKMRVEHVTVNIYILNQNKES